MDCSGVRNGIDKVGRQSGRQSEFPLTPTLSPRRGSTVDKGCDKGHRSSFAPKKHCSEELRATKLIVH
jgi:hypothetical protein